MNSSVPLYPPENKSEAIGESLSQAILSLFERRYLSNFNEKDWILEVAKRADRQLYLREVEEMSAVDSVEEIAQSIPFALSACHREGYAFTTVLAGDGRRHRLYLGGKIVGNSDISDYLENIGSAFRNLNNGLRLSKPYGLNSNNNPIIRKQIVEATHATIITGIPSGRNGVISLNRQGIDQISRAAGTDEFVVMLLAEPLSASEIDLTLDRCRRLLGEIHTLVKMSQSEGESITNTTSTAGSIDSPDSTNWGVDLMIVSAFLEAAKILLPQLNLLSRAVYTAGQAVHLLTAKPAQSQTFTKANGSTISKGLEILDAHAEACEQLLRRHIERLQQAHSSGWWNSAIYVTAKNARTLNAIVGTIKSIAGGDRTYLDPIREIKVSTELIKQAMLQGSLLSVKARSKAISHPLGNAFDYLSTCISSEELGVLAHLPAHQIQGIPMRRHARFALSMPDYPSEARTIQLGKLHEGIDQPLIDVRIDIQSLNRHTLIAGMPGSGKTTTTMQILEAAYRDYQIPFLAIEPAKKEYRELIRVRSLKDSLRVYSLGYNAPFPLQLNLFEFEQTSSLARHIDLVKAVFNASFTMSGAMMHILEEAIQDAYEDYGWDIHSGRNKYLPPLSTPDQRGLLMPTLGDVNKTIDKVIKRKGYTGEIESNLKAALKSRINSLTKGNKGAVLNVKRSIPIEELMTLPTVIELEDLGDDEEKAFVMAIILVKLCEYAPNRNLGEESLQHLTLIEEAHRLLSAKANSYISETSADSRGKAVAMFVDMLAEVRAYGEGLIIADQLPTKLAPEVLKNTNLKIIHRLSSPDDRHLVGQAIGLTDQQIAYLPGLPDFFAVIHDPAISEAVLTKVISITSSRKDHSFKQNHFKAKLTAIELHKLLSDRAKAARLSYLKKNSACFRCPHPCHYYDLYQSIGQEVGAHYSIASEEFSTGIFQKISYEEFRSLWAKWLPLIRHHIPVESRSSTSFSGAEYCVSTQFLREIIAVRAGNGLVTAVKAEAVYARIADLVAEMLTDPLSPVSASVYELFLNVNDGL